MVSKRCREKRPWIWRRKMQKGEQNDVRSEINAKCLRETQRAGDAHAGPAVTKKKIGRTRVLAVPNLIGGFSGHARRSTKSLLKGSAESCNNNSGQEYLVHSVSSSADKIATILRT